MGHDAGNVARAAARFKPVLTRRAALASAGAVAGAAALARPADAGARLPPGFVWGVAASAPQTEGSAGRGRSIWDVFAAEPGRIKGGATLAVGTGFETRYPGDLDLAAGAHLNAFRFSIAWPRILPEGKGRVNPAGLDLYDRIVDAMLARRLDPWMTLFHWDLPAALPGGWLNRDTAHRFADYAAIVTRRLGDRVRRVIMLNEPSVVAILGHALGWQAPGLASRAAFAAAMHHQNLAQGLGLAAVRSVLPGAARAGTTLSLQPCHPAAPGPAAAAANAVWDDAWNRAFLDPLMGRGYPARFAADLAPLIRPGDLAAIAARPDFLGVNYYSRMHILPAANVLGAGFGPAPAGVKLTGIGWPIEPDGLIEQLRTLRDEYGNLPVYITETGAAFADPAPAGGVVSDPGRIAFLRGQLQAAAAARAEGCALGGVFVWTLTDNFEWADGFTTKFGLVQVDRATLARTPKSSLFYLGRCAAANAVV